MGGVPAAAHRDVRKRIVPRGCIGPTGRYSPLQYPGGKGKLAKLMAAVVRANGLSDGRHIEPCAGDAGIAWELLITGVVRRVLVIDISPHVVASARRRTRGREVMFFSNGMSIPKLAAPMQEATLAAGDGAEAG